MFMYDAKNAQCQTCPSRARCEERGGPAAEIADFIGIPRPASEEHATFLIEVLDSVGQLVGGRAEAGLLLRHLAKVDPAAAQILLADPLGDVQLPRA